MSKLKQDLIENKIPLIAITIYCVFMQLVFGAMCPFKVFFHIDCPGCGLTRSCVRLLHLDFYRSFRNHPGFFVAAVTWIIISIFAFVGKPKCFRNSKVNLTILYITLGIYVLFSILRNIPGFEFLQPIDAV